MDELSIFLCPLSFLYIFNDFILLMIIKYIIIITQSQYIGQYMLNHSSKCLYLLAFLIHSLAIIDAKYFISPLNLYISDKNSSVVFKSLADKQQIIAILFTNKHCRECYNYEAQLINLIFRLNKEYQVRTFRCQLSINSCLQQEFNIKRFPMLHFVYGFQESYKFYLNNNVVTFETTIEIVKRLRYYISHEQDQNEGILLNMDKLYTDQKILVQYFGLNHIYNTLPLLLFKNGSQFEQKVLQSDISEAQRSSCAVFHRRRGKCFSPVSFQQIQYLFNLISYEKVKQFTEKSYKAFQQLNQNRYVFVAVLDSIFLRQKSREYLTMLNNILERRQFRNKIYIYWMQTQINKQKLVHLGLKQTDYAPLFALFDLTKSNKKIMTHEKGSPFTQQQIVSFIKDIIDYDEQNEMKLWNRQLLTQALERLSLRKKLYHINDLKEVNKQAKHFILSLPYAEYQLLQDNKFFFKPLINFNYLIQRVNRFLEEQIEINYIMFQKISYNGKGKSFGLFVYEKGQYERLSNQVIFDIEEAGQKIEQMFELPELFWVDQDKYQDYIIQNNHLSKKPFTYVQIMA